MFVFLSLAGKLRSAPGNKLKRLVGFRTFFSIFVKKYATVAPPLSGLVRKIGKICMKREMQRSLQK